MVRNADQESTTAPRSWSACSGTLSAAAQSDGRAEREESPQFEVVAGPQPGTSSSLHTPVRASPQDSMPTVRCPEEARRQTMLPLRSGPARRTITVLARRRGHESRLSHGVYAGPPGAHEGWLRSRASARHGEGARQIPFSGRDCSPQERLQNREPTQQLGALVKQTSVRSARCRSARLGPGDCRSLRLGRDRKAEGW